MAAQLNSYDEASLMHLWQHYAMRVNSFEPTKRWEEAALALCMIQAVRWKNQLFNYHLAVTASPAEKPDLPSFSDIFTQKSAKTPGGKDTDKERPKATVLPFRGKGEP